MAQAKFKCGSLIVAFYENVDKQVAEDILKSFNLNITHRYSLVNSFLIEVPAGKETHWAKALSQVPEIEGVDLNMSTQPA